ncbi:hypothetical protein CR513_57785, partial [Mucuna pruriens]
MQIRSLGEVESPTPLRYLIGAAVMMIGVVLPVGYMMFRNKRVPSSSSYSKQTEKKGLIVAAGLDYLIIWSCSMRILEFCDGKRGV